MTGRTGPLLLVGLVAAVLGGLAAIGIGSWAGWLSGDTVVVERVAAAPESGAESEAGLPQTAAARPLPGRAFDPAELYRRRSGGVVTIYAVFPEHAGTTVEARSQGSGFVVSSDGYVLTNSHVVTTAGEGEVGAAVEPATEVFVEFRDGSRSPATIVGWDVFDDVGLLRVDPAAAPLEPVPLGDSDAVVVGEPVAAIGSPFGQVSSLTVGVVSATDRAIESLTSAYAVPDAIQTDAPINRGNSGGPLFNARGEVIGINAQIRTESGVSEGVGFAIPINSARRSMEQLIATGEVAYAWIGVSTQTLTPSLARSLGSATPSGAAIQGIVPGGPAEKAGLRAGDEVVEIDGVQFRRGGDVVVEIDGLPVRSTEDLVRIVSRRLKPGETAIFTIARGGERLAVPVELGERPEAPQEAR